MRVHVPNLAPFLLMLFTACSGEAPIAPSAEAAGSTPAGAFSRTQVPMKGTYEGTGIFTSPPASCAGFYSVFSGVGQESHTGRYTLRQTTCAVPIDATSSSFTGEFTKTTANGDLLLGTHEGTTQLVEAPGPGSAVGIFAIAGTITFTGGTGRFDGASGSQRMEGTQWTDFSQPGFPSRMVLEFDGEFRTVGETGADIMDWIGDEYFKIRWRAFCPAGGEEWLGADMSKGKGRGR